MIHRDSYSIANERSARRWAQRRADRAFTRGFILGVTVTAAIMLWIVRLAR